MQNISEFCSAQILHVQICIILSCDFLSITKLADISKCGFRKGFLILRIMGGIGFFLRNDKNKIVVPSIKIRIFTKAKRI